jgi:hypothetical protein
MHTPHVFTDLNAKNLLVTNVRETKGTQIQKQEKKQ